MSPVNRSLTIFFLVLASLVWTISCQSVAQTQSLPTMKLHFPERWLEAEDRPLDFVEQIEVRTLSSSPGEFFFAAVPNAYGNEWPSNGHKRVYSENSYAVRFTPKPHVRAATKQEWESATRIKTTPRLVHWKGPDLSSSEIEYRGKKFQKTGKYWQSAGLSPGGKWMAIFSYTGERTRDLAFMDGGSVKNGDIFWDLYDTVTGEKVFEWRAANVKNPTVYGSPVVWLEERYFLFPEDEEAQNFALVTLPEFVAESYPINVTLPSRVGANGERVPAPANHPVWAPLPLTKEQVARIEAQQAPELVEVRSPRESSSQVLFLAIREVTENSQKSQPARGLEPGQNYNYRLFSTYYYAIHLDNPTISRFATKEEWESAPVRASRRLEISTDKKIEAAEGQDQRFRSFPKLGEKSGGSLRSYMSDWTAVFSYTEQAGAAASGKMFVEVFETRPRTKFSSSEFPYTGSPDALFTNAVWIQGNYLLVPLNSSLDSFAFWKLPGVN